MGNSTNKFNSVKREKIKKVKDYPSITALGFWAVSAKQEKNTGFRLDYRLHDWEIAHNTQP